MTESDLRGMTEPDRRAMTEVSPIAVIAEQHPTRRRLRRRM
jgi:hypothetical protein